MGECCNVIGCKRPATHGLKIRFWAQGRAKGSHSPGTVFLPVGLCLGHAAGAKPADFLSDKFWLRVESALLGMGHVPPDRNSAELEPAPIDEVSGKVSEVARDPYTLHLPEPEKMH